MSCRFYRMLSLMALLAMLMGGCGLKGDLYLPDEEGAAASRQN